MPVRGPGLCPSFPGYRLAAELLLYSDRLRNYYNSSVSPDWAGMVSKMMTILQEEAELNEIVRLVGVDALSFKDRITLNAPAPSAKTSCTRTLSTKWIPTPLWKNSMT